jgi:elongation factor G
MAFRIAGSIGMKEALRRGNPILLEPMMSIEVITPGDFLGDILGGLNGRRAQIRNLEGQGDIQVIAADIPLSETFGYATQLRSLTQGRANYSMEFSHYSKVPESIVQEVVHV